MFYGRPYPFEERRVERRPTMRFMSEMQSTAL